MQQVLSLPFDPHCSCTYWKALTAATCDSVPVDILNMFTSWSGQTGSTTNIMAHPLPIVVLSQWGKSIGAYRSQLPHPSGWVSEAFSMQFLKGFKHDWAPATHSSNVFINAPCTILFFFHISFPHLCFGESWTHLSNNTLELKFLFQSTSGQAQLKRGCKIYLHLHSNIYYLPPPNSVS